MPLIPVLVSLFLEKQDSFLPKYNFKEIDQFRVATLAQKSYVAVKLYFVYSILECEFTLLHMYFSPDDRI